MEENVIFIGSKPVMNYVLAVVTQFNGGADHVSLKARGKAISRAVDTAEIVRNGFIPNADVGDISIATEQIDTYNGEKTNVSTIEIKIVKKSEYLLLSLIFFNIIYGHACQIDILIILYLKFPFREPLPDLF